MRRHVLGWMDWRRAGAALLGVLAGATVAAWLAESRAAALASAGGALLVAGLLVRAGRTRPRVELEEQPARTPTEDTNSNVHVLGPEP